ncbi:MAG TPA: HlyD family efflux transporter periplasmic adaptor subunit [Steroidobacteraceae bacterium]|nr:HlyD family efflux transporter periplasmic adaptor subunit [Steroidobacteraceae bacterium]
MTLRNRWLLAGTVLGIAAFLVWVLTPAPVPVELATVTRGALEETVDEQAKTRIRDHYVLSAPLAGELERIALREGDAIAAGEPLARLRPVIPALLDVRTELELRRRVEAARAVQERAAARLAQSQVALAQARLEVERSRKLAESRLIPAAKLDSDELAFLMAQRELESANADVHVARHDVDIAVAAVSRAREGKRSDADWVLKAPIAGRVLRVQQKSAGNVAVGAPLIEIGDLANLEVVIEALTNEATRVTPGAPVTFDNWGGAQPLRGRVRRIEPWGFTKVSALGVEEQRVNILVDFLSPHERWASLGEGYRLDAHIEVYRNDAALRLPAGALFRSGAQWSVYAVGSNGRVQRVPVRIDHRGPVFAEALSGVSEGTRVVMYPGDNIADGVRVIAAAASGR